MKVKIKNYSELKDKEWFVEDMKPYAGRVTEVAWDLGNGFYLLLGCKDWQWYKDGFTVIEGK